MACLDENTIVGFFEGRLAQGAAAEVEEHLASCVACRDVLAEFAAMVPPDNLTEPVLGAGTSARASTAGVGSWTFDGEGRADLGRRVALAQARRRVGTVLSARWTLESVVGIGGMAQVFAATHRNGRAVAVKVLRPELAVEPLLVERFLREGYVANKVGHEGAVAILDDDVTSDGAPFLVMELLRGRTLRERVDADGPLLLEDALRATCAILDVLSAAHSKGIVHRDVKPDNLFETDRGEIKVLDFGIARLRERLEGGGQTLSGMTMGTVGYMAPEQARGHGDAVDPRSDVWAVGATLYTLLTGAVLHGAASQNESLLLAMTASVPPMRQLLPSLPMEVSSLLDRALAFDRDARFASAGAMREAVLSAWTSITREGSSPRLGPHPVATTDQEQVVDAVAAQPFLGSGDAKTTRFEAPRLAPRASRPLLAAAAVLVFLGVVMGIVAIQIHRAASVSEATSLVPPTPSELPAPPGELTPATALTPTATHPARDVGGTFRGVGAARVRADAGPSPSGSVHPDPLGPRR